MQGTQTWPVGGRGCFHISHRQADHRCGTCSWSGERDDANCRRAVCGITGRATVLASAERLRYKYHLTEMFSAFGALALVQPEELSAFGTGVTEEASDGCRSWIPPLPSPPRPGMPISPFVHALTVAETLRRGSLVNAIIGAGIFRLKYFSPGDFQFHAWARTRAPVARRPAILSLHASPPHTEAVQDSERVG